MSLEVFIYVIDAAGVEHERIVEVLDYNHHAGQRAITQGPPDDWHPGSPPSIEDVKCQWKGGAALTDAEWQEHGEKIEEAIWESMPTAQDLEDDAADRSWERYKERSL